MLTVCTLAGHTPLAGMNHHLSTATASHDAQQQHQHANMLTGKANNSKRSRSFWTSCLCLIWPRIYPRIMPRFSKTWTICWGKNKTRHTSPISILTLRLLMSYTYAYIYIYIYIYMERLLLMFLDHTQRRSTVGRTPLDEWTARRRDLYLTAHDTHNRQISMPPVGFEPTISAGERP